MKKTLLTFNVIFYAIQYSASLLYIGYEYGELSHLPYPRGPEYFLLPAVYLILLIVGIRLLREREYRTGKSYCVMAIVTLAYICLFWGSRLIFYFQGKMTMSNYLDIVVYPAVLAGFSAAIAVFYFVCAACTRKEYLQAVKQRAKEREALTNEQPNN